MKESKTNCGVYRITNTVPDKETGICKVYIGSSINLKSRKYAHFRELDKDIHPNIHLQRAYNRDGKENFKFEVVSYLEKCTDKQLLKESILEEEQKWMDELISCNEKYGYNLAPTAGNCLGVKHTDKSKENMSKAHKNKKASEETKKKMSEMRRGENHPLYGKSHSEEAKKKMSVSRKKRITSEETKKKMSASLRGDKNPNYGKKFSEEHRRKLSEAAKGRIPWNKGRKK